MWANRSEALMHVGYTKAGDKQTALTARQVACHCTRQNASCVAGFIAQS